MISYVDRHIDSKLLGRKSVIVPDKYFKLFLYIHVIKNYVFCNFRNASGELLGKCVGGN